MRDNTERIADEASRIEEDALHSAKGHWVASEVYSQVHTGLGLIATTSAAAASWFSDNNIDGQDSGIVTITAFIAAVSAALMAFVKPQKLSSEHHHVGNLYKTVNNNSRMLKNTMLMQDAEIAIQKLDELQQAHNQINEDSPYIIPKWARKIANRRIENGEHKYKVDGSSQYSNT